PGPPAAGRARGPGGRARRPGPAAGDQPDADRGDLAVPGGRLTRGNGLHRRALRAPLVREEPLRRGPRGAAIIFRAAPSSLRVRAAHRHQERPWTKRYRPTSTPSTPRTARCSTG